MEMKRTQAFCETRGHKTVVVVFADNPGGYFVVQINHEGGAVSAHPVVFELTLNKAREVASRFLSEAKGGKEEG